MKSFLPFLFNQLFKNNADAEADVVVERTAGVNRIVINLYGAEINAVVDFDV